MSDRGQKQVLLLFFCLLVSSFSMLCRPIEYITSFHADIRVNENGSIHVIETINYVNKGKKVHGIYRDFPIKYKGLFGIKLLVGFDLQKVVKNGQKEPFKLESIPGGKRIYIGDPDTYIKPGTYTYKIIYKTTHQILFFEKYDELYWNVNGTGWRLPIDTVSATVTLPKGIAPQDIHVEGYTGKRGKRGTDYNALVSKQSQAIFNTTRAFGPGENLTIVVTWPKGFVTEPTWSQNMLLFIYNNLGFLLAVLFFILLLIIGIRFWILLKKSQYIGTIIPLFYPPEGIGSDAMRYILQFGYDNKTFACKMIQMAVAGLLRIKYEPGRFWSGTYTLIKKKIPIDKTISVDQQHILSLLFAYGDEVALNEKNRKIVKPAIDFLKKRLANQCDSYFISKSRYYTIFFIFAAFFLTFFLFQCIDLFFLIFVGIVIIVFLLILKGYTKEGLNIKKQIEGFKLFLATTEEDRLKVIGTPPTKNPQLYETYLPYAIALGVEKQWTKKFVPVFAKLAQEGTPYVPIWYVGPGRFDALKADQFVSDLTRSLSQSSKTGVGGGGTSGGGRGGGGGGSW